MAIQSITLYVDGMTCASCEARISRTLSALKGVRRADARLQGGRVTVEFDDSLASEEVMREAVEKAGYSVRREKGSGNILPIGIGLLLVFLYLLAASRGVFSSLPAIDASIGYSMLFAVGLLTSIHCIAMCGGIALSQSLGSPGRRSGPLSGVSPSRLRQLLPGLKYNAGRVVSYTLIGALVGALGAAFSFSPAVKGAIALVAGIFMVFFALRMLGLFSGLPKAVGVFPPFIKGALMKASSSLQKGGPFAVGILNGLMPCGPLQTMQLYALGTGSALAGALSMFLFSLGTVPLMLLFGVSASFLPHRFFPSMLKASAVLVMFLGVLTFARAAGMAGFSLPSPDGITFRPSGGPKASGEVLEAADKAAVPGRKSAPAGLIQATVSGGVQTVLTVFKNGRYVPFSAQVGIPVKWTIRIDEEDITGCNNTLIIPSYGIEMPLRAGDNVIEFTPKKEGTIPYSCWMGMIRSKIVVTGGEGQEAQGSNE
jgi:sulfite exporter TauE/SafE/copper chaperone CopZ